MEETQITYNVKKMRVGEHVNSASTKYYPVFSENDEELYCVSADRKDLRVNIKYVLRGTPIRSRHKATRISELFLERNEYLHTRIACNIPDFYDQVETLTSKNECRVMRYSRYAV